MWDIGSNEIGMTDVPLAAHVVDMMCGIQFHLDGLGTVNTVKTPQDPQVGQRMHLAVEDGLVIGR